MPEPELPTTATVSPARTSKLTSCKMVSGVTPFGTDLVNDLTESMKSEVMELFTRFIVRAALALAASSMLVGGAGAAGPVAVASAKAAAHGPVILIFGDSLSAEYGLARGTGWAALLEQRLKQKQINYSVANASISGETTSGGAARIETVLKQNRPAVVVIELGGNDGLRGLSLDATRANFETMIKVSKAAGAKIVLAGMQLPPNYGPAYTNAFRALYGELAARHKAALVPFFLEGVADQRELFQADGIHPVAAAQGALLDNVWPALAPLLIKAPNSGPKANPKPAPQTARHSVPQPAPK